MPLEFYREVLPTWSPRTARTEHMDPDEKTRLLGAWYREAAETELFTETEADQLIDWVEWTYRDNVFHLRKTATHSLPEGVVGCGAIPAGGGNELVLLYKRESYHLPFKTLILVSLQDADGWSPELACLDLRKLATPRQDMAEIKSATAFAARFTSPTSK